MMKKQKHPQTKKKLAEVLHVGLKRSDQIEAVHICIQFRQSVKRKGKTTINWFSQAFLSYNLGRAAGGTFFLSFLFFFLVAALFVFRFGKNTKSCVHVHSFGPDGGYYMKSAIPKMNPIKVDCWSKAFSLQEKAIPVISTMVLYLGVLGLSTEELVHVQLV